MHDHALLCGGIADADLTGGTPVDQENKIMDWTAVENAITRSAARIKGQGSARQE